MKISLTKDQFAAIRKKFEEIRIEVSKTQFPAGARPTASDMWTMATSLIIAENM